MKNTFCYVAVRTRLELVTPCVTGMYSKTHQLLLDFEYKITCFLECSKLYKHFFDHC